MTQKFPSYTTKELKTRVISLKVGLYEPFPSQASIQEQIAELEGEIAAREAGVSTPFVTPQVGW